MGSSVHHLSIFIRDMARTLTLFKDILGFKLSWHLPSVRGKTLSALLGIENLECELAYLTGCDNGVAIELSRIIHPPVENTGIGFGHLGTCCLSIEVDNLDRLYTRLEREGWQPQSRIMTLKSPDGDPINVFCIRIENHTTIELIEKRASAQV